MKTIHIKVILSIALIAIISLQSLWLYNMYVANRNLKSEQIVQTLATSINKELSNRRELMQMPLNWTILPYKNDNLNMKNVKVIAEDTTYLLNNYVNIHDENQTTQLALKPFIPINVPNLDSIFRKSLLKLGIPVEKTYIEYFDRDINTVLLTKNPIIDPFNQSFETPLLFVDILKSIGIKAYVNIPYSDILKEMFFQLILSVILIILAVSCLFILLNTIIQQWKKENLRRNFIDTMTHELKRPLATSIFSLQYLLDHIHDCDLSEMKELLSESVSALGKQNLYIEKIQEISTGEEGNVNLLMEPLFLYPFFDKLKKQYESSDHKKVSIQLFVDEELSLTIDVLHFSNIAENLIENSIKYSNEDVSIEISGYKENGEITIKHRDNGWGISKEELPYIFDKFYRGKTVEKRKKRGFGLGLSYVKMMTEKMGGHIVAISEKNKFTEFILLFNP
jgi:signal transduction histidine kinase